MGSMPSLGQCSALESTIKSHRTFANNDIHESANKIDTGPTGKEQNVQNVSIMV